MDEIIDFRGAIELWCLIKLLDSLEAKTPMAKEVISELQSIVDGMENAAARDDRESLKEDDYRFHLTIIKSSRTPLFISIYETLRSFLIDEIDKSQNDYKDPAQIYHEHNHLLQTITLGGRKELITDYIGHITNIKKRLEICRNQVAHS